MHTQAWRKFLSITALVGVIGICAGQRAYAGQKFEIHIVSSRADAISGGDVLVQLGADTGSHWSAHLNGRDVSDRFKREPQSGDQIALLTSLEVGANTLLLLANGKLQSKLELLNHPLAGPVLSGPHQRPFICQTAENGLGPALDTDCYAKAVVHYYYKSNKPTDASRTAADAAAQTLTSGFKSYDPTTPYPRDVAQTVISTGRTVDYMVRREIGVINRAIYEIQFLHRPGSPLPNPWATTHGSWNGRLVYAFKSGCAPGYRQGVLSDAIGSVQEPLLSQGYALAQSTLNDFGTNCNDRLSAETLSMVKEYFIKRYGNPVHTIGTGGSGGAMQLHLIAQNYPGLLDGIIPMGSFPDVVTYLQWEADSNLLIDALQASRQSWTAGQKTAVLGYATWYQRRNRKDEGASCDSSIPIEWRYQRTANPNGVRCNEYDNEVNVFGRNPHTGFAWRPFDNVGVQYGIRALNRGEISTEQFIELNERVGGFDPQGAPSTSRAEADPEAVRLVYERGLLLRRGEGLSEIPIIDWRAYSDDLGGSVDGHFRFLSFVTRARLLAANGRTDNQVILVDPRESWFDWVGFRGASHFWGPVGQLVPEMDRWLDHIDLDQERGSRAEKIVRDKPPSLADSCMTLDGERIIEPASVDGVGRCNAIYPSHADPRLVAGAPLSDDILKCALKPIKMADYAQSLTEAQLIRLQAVFPKGVCDYTQPGIGQSVTWKTWQRF